MHEKLLKKILEDGIKQNALLKIDVVMYVLIINSFYVLAVVVFFWWGVFLTLT